MPVIVQKYGGTSVGDAYRIHRVARRVIRAKLAGNQVIVVVSAMGDTTDRLLQLAHQVSRRPARRELDMLVSTGEQVSIALVAMAIHEAGYEAISLTGSQVGMLTDSRHTQARIRSIETARVQEQLNHGKIVIVAGFQGVNERHEVTTLGRGGSDTTAVALAVTFGSPVCEIYTDVDGVYTADPRLVPEARRLETISYDEMLELASRGAQVMHPRAIEFGNKHAIPIHVRNSGTDTPGTTIMSATPDMEAVLVRGATLKRNVGRITLVGVPNRPGVVAPLFGELAERGVSVDDIIQTISASGERANVSFTVDAADLPTAHGVADGVAQRYSVAEEQVEGDLARVSLVGVGMRSHSGVAARMFRALAEAGINVENISTSEIVISVLVKEAQGEQALRVVHEAFGLGGGG